MAYTVRFYNWFKRLSDGKLTDGSWDAFKLNEDVETMMLVTGGKDGRVEYQINACDGRAFKCAENLGTIVDGERWILIETEPGADGGAIFRRISTNKMFSFYDVRGIRDD